MKHQTSILNDYLNDLQLNLSVSQLDALEKHLNFVLETNSRVQLTSIRDHDAGVRLHIVDSLSCAKEVLACGEGPLLDMGSGGGFPGIPLAVVTGYDVTLLDSVKKKMSVLEELIKSDKAYSNVSVCSQRAEDLAAQKPNYYNVVTARALSSLPAIIELATPLLKNDGYLVALKGDISPEELKSGDSCARLVGLKRISLRRFTLSGGSEQRCVLLYKKGRKSQVKLPRRTGLAQHKPLA